MRERPDARIAVLDVGKTNVKLSAVCQDGTILETVSVANRVVDGPFWREHDLVGIGDWVMSSLTELCLRHDITAVVTSGHGSGGVLVGGDPDHNGDGAALPMIDYEQPLPEDIRLGYVPLSGSFFDRGSALMLGATHQARQMYWMQQVQPEAFAKARWFLGVPQYWAWRLSGVAVSEATFLGAQSHFWNTVERHWAPIVAACGWQALMPPFAAAWQRIGKIRPALADRYGIARDIDVLAGIHDSSANFYRYQAAGLEQATVVSTGTWIVALSSTVALARLDEHRGMTCNADVDGRPVGGALTMGGREFSLVAGQQAEGPPVSIETLLRLVDRGTMALPSFGDDDGLFPGSAGQGRIVGPLPGDPAERKALAVLYTALLTAECLDALGSEGLVVLDGNFLREPLYAGLVAALRPGRETLYSLDAYGVASGAALLAGHATRRDKAPIALNTPVSIAFPSIPGTGDALAGYAQRWRRLSRSNTQLHTDTQAHPKPGNMTERSTP
ncbi:carbohydrate kinase [Pararhizobium antarcticum]|uniref:Carbohydrate kinase n=2 Tax=Pararhizobium antarcticum TaxID=1798805 RepID=A0A657M336_9HYPH|nr:FGGY family carbohydrate kinase [Pararhizobium antarcticum]OJG00142.1 carbohydrate kinase [Rhizobium sp. 58]OJG01600.1 carbohydrate kinase [Pararhizobium antarcticum]